MKNSLLIAVAVFSALAVAFSFSPVLAKSVNIQEIPDQNGTYNVSGHPNLKVRVFVHYPKTPQSNPATTCTINDPLNGPFVDPAGWHLPNGWTYYLNTSTAPTGVIQTNLKNIAGNAFSEWTTAVSGKVNFTLKGNTTANKKALDGKNVVAWGNVPGSALAITYTWYNPQTKEAVETDTIMNKKFPWAWTQYSSTACANPSAYDAQDILTHELGHWVGLNDEYAGDYVSNTMYGYGSKGEIIKDTLTSGDSAGAYNIYK